MQLFEKLRLSLEKNFEALDGLCVGDFEMPGCDALTTN